MPGSRNLPPTLANPRCWRLTIAGLLVLLMPWVATRAAACSAPAQAATVAVPGHPFAAVATPDGCWVFVSVDRGNARSALAVLRNQNGAFAFDHRFDLDSNSYGASLTRDGRILALAAGDQTLLLDAAALERGDAHPLLGRLRDGPNAGAIYTALGPDDRWLFVSDEQEQRISVFDLAKARADGFRERAPTGRIPTALAPVGLAVSPDGRWLYATSQVAPTGMGLHATCKPEEHELSPHPPGLLLRIDLGKVAADAAHAVVAALPAGCNPVRVAVSPSGRQLWVTARGDNALLRFQADDWLSGTQRSSYRVFSIGSSPVGVTVRPDDKQVWVALSNRFGSASGGKLAGLAYGADDAPLRLMSMPAAGFPREVGFLPDGRTLVATLFNSDEVAFVPTPD